tara:strand:- start:16 stop:279 length:264 start_codon:yes stop_codon:yes gene_type:complete
MPKYRYGCNNCNREWLQWNSLGAVDVECPHCFSKKINKLPVNFVVVQDTPNEQKTAGENVIDHIEENKKILKKIKQRSSEEMEVNND